LSVTDQILVMADGRPRVFGPRDQVLQKLAGKNPDTVAASDTPSAQPAEAA